MNGNRQQPPAEWLMDRGPERSWWMGACVRSHEEEHWRWVSWSGPAHPSITSNHIIPGPWAALTLTRLYCPKTIKWIIGKAPLRRGPPPREAPGKPHPQSVWWSTPKHEERSPDDCTCSPPTNSPTLHAGLVSEDDRGDGAALTPRRSSLLLSPRSTWTSVVVLLLDEPRCWRVSIHSISAVEGLCGSGRTRQTGPGARTQDMIRSSRRSSHLNAGLVSWRWCLRDEPWLRCEDVHFRGSDMVKVPLHLMSPALRLRRARRRSALPPSLRPTHCDAVPSDGWQATQNERGRKGATSGSYPSQ